MLCNRRNFIKRFLTLGAAVVTTAPANTGTPAATKLTTLKIAGLQYGELAKEPLRPDEPLQLIREPDNPYDRYAVAIYRADKKAGYIPKTNSRIVASLMDSGIELGVRVRYFDEKKEPWNRVWVSVWIID